MKENKKIKLLVAGKEERLDQCKKVFDEIGNNVTAIEIGKKNQIII